MARRALGLVLAILAAASLAAQESPDVYKALAQGDLYLSKRRYALALDAYHKADKLAHHSSAACYLKIASVERKLGDLSSALDDAKRAVKAAGENKSAAVEAYLFRAVLLTQMAGKPTDKKLKEAEGELRQALALDAAQPVIHYNLGMVLLKQQRDTEGLAELNTFVSTPGADPGTLAEARRVIANPIRAREPFAPDFSFTTHENQDVSNVALRGKVVLLDFWGTWCPPCRASVPMLRGLQKKYAGKPFQLIGVSSDNDEDVWRTFIEAQRMDWLEYIDLSGDVLKAFKVESFPTYVVVDRDGVIRFRQSGLSPNTGADLEDAINKALKRASDPTLAAAAAAEAPARPATSAGASASLAVRGETPPAPASPETPLLDIETATISGNVYKNQALGLTYEFPQGWTAAKPESLHEVNEQAQAAALAALMQQHPEADPARVSGPRIVFYASHRAGGDGRRIGIPSLRITAVPSRVGSLDQNAFRRTTDYLAMASQMKVIAPAAEFTVKQHSFLRADFERSAGSSRVCQAYIQTLAGDYLLTIELFATSPAELQQIAASLQSISISEEGR